MAREARGGRGRDTKDPEGVGSVLGTCKERERASVRILCLYLIRIDL